MEGMVGYIIPENCWESDNELNVEISLKSLAPPFAIGHTAEIYAWGNEYVLKLFREWFPLRAIEHEARVVRIVHHAGLPAPAVVGDIVKINGRYGLVYERVSGKHWCSGGS